MSLSGGSFFMSLNFIIFAASKKDVHEFDL